MRDDEENPDEIPEPPPASGEAPEAPAPAPAGSPPPAPAEPTLEDKLATVEREKKETYDRLLRTAADFDNFRKRTRRDVEDSRVKGREEVLREILPVLDNLERALIVGQAGGGDNVQSLLEGVRLVLRQFQNALERFDVRGFPSVGQPFDPTRHEAISHVESGEHPPGAVTDEMQKGYTIGSRLLRPALVSVAKAPAPAPEPAPVSEPATAVEHEPNKPEPEST